jgi:ABC-type multidrug transport system fused ATPase/permease subunit
MKDFLRSLRYLRPYRARLAVAVACVIFIAILWGGGLGLLLPAAKVLMSPEGIHGWAYQGVAEDRLDAKIVFQDASVRLEDGRSIENALNVYDIGEPTGPAAAAGLAAGDWLIGLDSPDQDRRLMRGVSLAAAIADAPEGEPLRLRVYSTARGGEIRTVSVALDQAKLDSRALGYLADQVPPPASFSDRVPIFIGLLAVVWVVTVLRAIFSFIQEYLVGTAVWRGIMDLRCANYAAVLRLPVTYFSQKGTSDSMSRFIADTNQLAKGQITLLGKTLVEPAKALAVLVLALYLSWPLTLLALVAGPLAFLMIRRLGKSMHRASRRALESWSSIVAVLEETLGGIRVVKAYTMEGAERRRFFRVNRSLLKQLNKMERIDAGVGPLVETLGLTAALAAAGMAGYMVFRGITIFGNVYRMDPYVFLGWLVALGALFDPIRKLAKVSTKFQQSDAAARRVFEVQDAEPEHSPPGAPSLGRHHQAIEFRNISYQYPGSEAYALRNVNLTVNFGQTVAIVGPNGCGKTTLVSLLPRLLEATDGQVLIDGQDIRNVSLRSLRRQIGLVTQDTVMFHATIAENVGYGSSRPAREKVLEASRKAYVDEFVANMPEGYETMVGEHGSTLSGGQKQRISIARAILRDPTILIFDEALSQVDPDSEQKISRAMAEFVKGRTTLMIAHRFQTVLSADMIVVMADGAIIDCGRHSELLGRCELYQHLYRTQLTENS